MEIRQLKNILKNSYKNTNQQQQNINGLVRDDSLWGKRAQVYVDPLTNEATVVYRGTQDIFTDAALSVGILNMLRKFNGEQKRNMMLQILSVILLAQH